MIDFCADYVYVYIFRGHNLRYGVKAILYLLFFLLASTIPSPECPRHTSHHTQLSKHQQYEQFQYFLRGQIITYNQLIINILHNK